MNNLIKTVLLQAAVSAVVSAIVFTVGLGLVGSQSAQDLGAAIGTTRFPNSGIVAQYFNASSTSATSNFAGAVSIAGLFSITGDTHTGSLVQGGSIATLTGTSTQSVSAANVCDNSVVQWAPTVTEATATLPTAIALAADCMTSNGDFKDILFLNTSSTATTTVVVANASTTLLGPSTGDDILVAGADAIVRFVRTSATTMTVNIQKIVDAD